jgi:outer membrane protein
MNREITVMVLCLLASTQLRAGADVLRLSLRHAIELALSPGTLKVDLGKQQAAAAALRVRQEKVPTSLLAEASIADRAFRVDLRALGIDIPQFSQFISTIQFPETEGPFSVLDPRIRATKSLINRAAAKRVRAAEGGIDELRSAGNEVREQIAAETTRVYLETVRSSEIVELAQSAIELSRAFVSFATERKSNGLAVESEVRRATMELNSNRQKLSAARVAQGRSILRLLYLLNLDFNQTLELTDRFLPATHEITLEDAIAAAGRTNPSLATQQVRAQNLRLSDDAVRATWQPTLTAFGDFGGVIVAPDPSGGDLSKSFTWVAGLELKIPVFDGHRREIEHENLLLQMRQQEIRQRDLRRQIELNVRMAFSSLVESRQQLELAAENAKAADLDLTEIRANHSAGNSSALEVREAEARKAQAEDGQIAALYQNTLARLALAEAIGSVSSLDW